jgi:CRP-like cAMP-binding protein
LTEKEATVNTVAATKADTKTYAEILRDIPAFSSCAPDVLDRFVTEKVFSMYTGAGREVCARTDASDNLYVVVAGRAFLDAGDVRVALEPGDYFGGDAGHHRRTLSASVVADEDVEVLVISPEEIARLQHSASRRHHPSNADWTPEVAPSLRLLPSRRRFGVLARSGS